MLPRRTWHVARRTWHVARGTRHIARGTSHVARGTWHVAHRTWHVARGTWHSRWMIDDLWYKNAIIYCLDVEKYLDSDGDGIGDFEGLTRKLDYVAGLGVTCLWLQPFYPSPNKDNG